MPKKVNDIAELAKGLGFDAKGLAEVRRKVASRSVSRTLAALRASKGLTQKELAARMGRTQSALSKLETTDNDDFRLGDVRAYASALGLRVSVSLEEPRTLAQEIRLQLNNFVGLIDRLKEYDGGDASVSASIDKFKNDMSGTFLDLFLKLTPAASIPAGNGNPELSVGALPEQMDLDTSRSVI